MKPTKKKKLIDQVKSIKVRKNKVEPDTEVAIAWLKNEIRLSQISRALWPEKDLNTSTLCYAFLNNSMQEAYRQGRIKIVK